ncbi:TetR/AcrR family transcriptional regulator [Arcticibacter tournemirensis]
MRKKYQGEVNDKERSMRKLIDAVGTVIQTYGYTGLTSTNISKTAGLDRKLISLYFGSVNNLVETYVKTKDYWVAATGEASDKMRYNKGSNTRELLEAVLLNQLDYFGNNTEMQKIVLWQLSEQTDIMKHVCAEREKLSTLFFALSDKELEDRKVDLRATAALLVAGIYYLVLHAKSDSGLFCEIDINSKQGMNRIKDAVKAILEDAYNRQENK